ncbi:MAG: hypothetical protein F4X27_07890 [Chloroflexi bacterium]|nr:hypothetical protein [Chloroflexota bacterium]
MLEPESSEKYAAMSQRYIEQADEEFEKGDLGQASNKAWGAAALALKSIAERRGWNHNKHGLLYDISGQMADELGQPELRIMFRSANAMHQNYYEDWMAVDEVRDGIETAKAYLRELEAAQDSASAGFVPETAEQAARLRRLTGG